MNTRLGITSRSLRSLMWWLAVCVLAVSAAGEARAQEFPHEIFEPYGVPTIEGARVLKTRIENDKKLYAVAYDATFEQVMQWVDNMVAKGMILSNKEKNSLEEDRNRKNHLNTISLHFPLGTSGNQQEIYVVLDYSWHLIPAGYIFPRSVGASAAIEIRPIYGSGSTKPKLETPQADILSPLGLTDISGFVPEHTMQFFANTIKADKVLRSDLPAGTPVAGTLEARFTHGYVPKFTDVDRWAKAIYKACAANASAIEPLESSSEIATTHWWTYTYRGVSYQAYVTADLDHLGRFEFATRRQ